jgi:YegS/Rv2252/BmrU family lipid kinase
MIDRNKPVHVIINPTSGYGGQKMRLTEFRTAMRERQWEVVEHVTHSAGDATRFATAVRDEAAAVIAWGGDGTVNEVSNGLLGTEVPILIYPAGTENLLAKELHLPRNPVEMVTLLESGKMMDCDVGLINGQKFHSILGVGFDAEVVRRLSVTRRGHISHLSYFWPVWRTFWEHDFPTLHIEADGEKIFDGRGLAFVGNISRYSVGLRICLEARFDDGLLDLVVFRCHEQTGLLLHAAWTLLRRHPLKGNVIYRPAKQIHIETDRPMTCEMDGDVGPSTPLDISLAEEKIRLIVPAQRSRWGLRPLWPWKGPPL